MAMKLSLVRLTEDLEAVTLDAKNGFVLHSPCCFVNCGGDANNTSWLFLLYFQASRH